MVCSPVCSVFTAPTMACASSSSCFSLFLAYGTLTVSAPWSIGVTTMKMIRSTRKMSTKGVTLMSELRPPPPPTFIDMLLATRPLPLQEEIDQLRRRVGHLDPEELDLALEIVEHPHRGDGHGQPHRGGDQRLGNTGRHGADPARTGGGHAGERVDDPDDRAEQTDERRRGADGRQASEAALHLGRGQSRGPLDRQADRLDGVVRRLL